MTLPIIRNPINLMEERYEFQTNTNCVEKNSSKHRY